MSDQNQSTALAPVAESHSRGRSLSAFESAGAFESAQRMARALITSDLVPDNYRGESKMGNALIAMDMANRMGLSPMVVMQNMHVIEGRPSWASSFIISALNSCGLFSPLRFRVTDLGEREASYDKWQGPKGQRTKVTQKAKIQDKEFMAYAVEKGTGEVLEGPPVTFSMAVAEGWYFKPGSKWQTMPDLMGRYRAAAFFGRLYAPHILNGMQTDDEVMDIQEYRVVSSIDPEPEPEPKDAPKGRARGVHAAMKTGEPDKKAEPKKSGGKKAAKPEPEPTAEQESDVTDAEHKDLPPEDGEPEAQDGDVFGPDDDDDGNWEPA